MAFVLLNVLYPVLLKAAANDAVPEKPSEHGSTPEKPRPRLCGIEDVATWGRTRAQSHG